MGRSQVLVERKDRAMYHIMAERWDGYVEQKAEASSRAIAQQIMREKRVRANEDSAGWWVRWWIVKA